MYLTDFKKLVDCHAAPWSNIEFYKTKWGPEDIVTIMDWNAPRREGLRTLGWTETAWYLNSAICNVTVLNGEVPLENDAGEWIEEGPDVMPHWKKRPVAGARRVLNNLLGQGLIVPSQKLDRLLRKPSIRLAHESNRKHYKWDSDFDE